MYLLQRSINDLQGAAHLVVFLLIVLVALQVYVIFRRAIE